MISGLKRVDKERIEAKGEEARFGESCEQHFLLFGKSLASERIDLGSEK